MPFYKSVGKQLFKSGIGLASDVIGGKSLKEADISRRKNVARIAFKDMRDAFSKDHILPQQMTRNRQRNHKKNEKEKMMYSTRNSSYLTDSIRKKCLIVTKCS